MQTMARTSTAQVQRRSSRPADVNADTTSVVARVRKPAREKVTTMPTTWRATMPNRPMRRAADGVIKKRATVNGKMRFSKRARSFGFCVSAAS